MTMRADGFPDRGGRAGMAYRVVSAQFSPQVAWKLRNCVSVTHITQEKPVA
jgi:hypothetical protein